MAKDEVLYGYALLDESGRTIYIDDIDRQFTRRHKFYCPHCHNEMYATFGEVQLPHFRHNGDRCRHEQYLHDLAEHVFYEEYSQCLKNGLPFFLELGIPIPCNKACVLKDHADCREHYIRKTVDLTREYTLISLETRVDVDGGYRRPDVLLESLDGNQLWIEIWVSHETDEEKRREGRIIEIKIDSERDLEKIRQHRIVQSEGKDSSVRLFGIDRNVAEESEPAIKYPCEQYYCFEVGNGDVREEIIDDIRTTIDPDLSYRAVLRLNWQGGHRGEEGNKGEQVTDRVLRDFCFGRYYSNGGDDPRFLSRSYVPLLVSEWKAASFRPTLIQGRTAYRRSCNKPRNSSPKQLTMPTAEISNMEWVDLGLPSGILWANADIEGTTTFSLARNAFGAHIPSMSNARELYDHCTIVWEARTQELIFSGPNGNTISFPCKVANKSYWLDISYWQDGEAFGQCFHIGPDRHFWINDKDASSAIHVRLVRR